MILAAPANGILQFVYHDQEGNSRADAAQWEEGGVLTDTGQTSVATRVTIEKVGATAMYVPLIKFERIYAALAAGEIDAGALPIDLRFTGQLRYGWNAFPLNEFGTPSIFATTRKLIISNRALVMNIVQGLVETIHLFKTRPDIVVPLLQR